MNPDLRIHPVLEKKSVPPWPQARTPVRPQGEEELVERLVETAARSGVRADRESIVNCYVALKSKPLAILAGPPDCGKVALIQSLARVLVGPECDRCQVMLGHAWWAAGSSGVAIFTEAQARLVASKVFDLVAAAQEPGNAGRFFLGCLAHISRAELVNFFSEVAFQLGHGQLMQLPSVHLSEPVPYPANLCLVGTMDTERFEDWDDDLLTQATVVLWPAQTTLPMVEDGSETSGCPVDESCFFLSAIRSEREAFRKLHTLRGWLPALMEPLWRVDELLRDHQARVPDAALGEALIYVANAWSREGRGLFHSTMGCNLMTALDLAILQTLLVRAVEQVCGSAALRSRSMDILGSRFPRSAAFVSTV